jgi:signal peptidase I
VVEQSGRRSRARLVILVAVIALAVLVVAAGQGLRERLHIYYIPSANMEPTYPVGSRVLVTKPGDAPPKAGEVVVHEMSDPVPGLVIKRVIAVGPATVAFDHGGVVVDGRPLDEPYLAPGTQTLPAPRELGPQCTAADPCAVAEGELWVMGDNRTNSQDSRHIGPVRTDAVTGIVTRRLF